MSFKLQRIEPLFVNPLVAFDVADSAALNAALVKEIDVRRKSEESIRRSNRLGWHSETDFFMRKEPAHRDLARRILGMVVTATQRVAPDADLDSYEIACEGWINVNPPQAYNAPHDHTGALWSGTYYVVVPQAPKDHVDSGAIEFLSGFPTSAYNKVLPSAMTADKLRIRPSEGQCLLFPGTLKHWVHPHTERGDRITIAFNAVIRKKAGAAPPRS